MKGVIKAFEAIPHARYRRRVEAGSNITTVEAGDYSDRLEVWWQVPVVKGEVQTAVDLFEDLKAVVHTHGLSGLTAHALNMYQQMCRLYPDMILLERCEHHFTEHPDNTLSHRAMMRVVPSDTMLIELVTPKEQVKHLTGVLNKWDDAICAGDLGHARRHAVYLVNRVILRGLQPACAHGLWHGFVQWCVAQNIPRAGNLSQEVD